MANLKPVVTPILFILGIICCLPLISVAAAEEETVSTASAAGSAFPSLPERRKEQFQTSFGYALFPYPYNIPGIGGGVGLVGGAMNINNTYTDVYGIAFSGDVEGVAAGVADIHLIPRTLVLDLGFGRVSKATFQSYAARGMDTDKEDYRLIEIGNSENYGGRLTATFLDRHIEFYGGWYESASKLRSIRDKDGNIIVQAQDAARVRRISTFMGTRFDLTDDYSDPRRGVRLDISRYANPPADSGPDFAVMDYNLTGYLPIGSRNTWVFNHLRSDALVSRQGVTDSATIQQQQGINCANPALTPQQQQYCLGVVNNIVANNTYGTATSLGGLSRLRSYSQSRFSGAHTQFYGTEFRWNLTDEATPFDIFVMKDIRTSLQVAVFYELGSTADLQQEVGKTWRDSYGVGLRMITASGVVFRADIANGQDGMATEIFIGYPWEIF
ncbi:MAG TPA: BamA/TamA family outer membrane protein [Gallionellaceae bacterium]|nr:BamA/TamA family outer membrane protein [Gallionellaceae bacterium]